MYPLPITWLIDIGSELHMLQAMKGSGSDHLDTVKHLFVHMCRLYADNCNLQSDSVQHKVKTELFASSCGNFQLPIESGYERDHY